MINRSFIRRLERLETRWGVHRIPRIRVEYYDRSPGGTLIRRPNSDNNPTEADHTIRVVYVEPELKGDGPNPL